MKILNKLFLAAILAAPVLAFSATKSQAASDLKKQTEFILYNSEVIVDQLAAKITNTFTKIKNCQPDSQVFQQEEQDAAVSFFGTVPSNMRARECVSDNLQKTNDSICKAKQKLVQMMNSHNYNDLNSIMYRVQSMKRSYQDRLYDLSQQNAAAIGKHEGEKAFSHYLKDQEAMAYESIFLEEAIYECDPYAILDYS